MCVFLKVSVSLMGGQRRGRGGREEEEEEEEASRQQPRPLGRGKCIFSALRKAASQTGASEHTTCPKEVLWVHTQKCLIVFPVLFDSCTLPRLATKPRSSPDQLFVGKVLLPFSFSPRPCFPPCPSLPFPTHAQRCDSARTDISLFELARQVPSHKGGLAHTAIAHEDEFKFWGRAHLCSPFFTA